MAWASASWASGESAPSDMPALSKRGIKSSTDSTSSIDSGVSAALRRSRSRSVDTGRSLTSRAKVFHLA
jgi:hypothetical protein